jgi:DNA invertase Pin-like site-specific DNA recombinase
MRRRATPKAAASDRSGLPGAIYSRISSVYGERADSLDNQDEKCAIIAAKMGIAVPPEFRVKERDSGHETIDTRPKLLQIRRWAREGRISTVFNHAWDRLSRTPEELVSVWQELRGQGVEVVCIQNPIHDLDLSLAKMILRMQGMVGEMEWEYIRRRTTENKERIRADGRRVGEGGPIFGYRWVRDLRGRIDPARAWEPVEEEATIVRLIYDLVGNRAYTLDRLIEELNGRGIAPPSVMRGRKFADGRTPRWSRNVAKMIRDPSYKGTGTGGRTRAIGDGRYRQVHPADQTPLANSPTPAIVDAATWDRANAIIVHRRPAGFDRGRRTAEDRDDRPMAFLRGIIRCSCCGRPLRVVLTRQWSPADRAHVGPHKVAYRCERRWDHSLAPEDRACSGRRVYDDKVREPAWRKFVEVITTDGWIEAKARALKAKRPGEEPLRDSLDIARQEAGRTARRIGNVIDQMADADDPEDRDDLRAKLALLRREAKGYAARIESIAEKLRAYDRLDAQAASLVTSVRAIRERLTDPDRMTWAERRQVVDDIGATFVGSGLELELCLDLMSEDLTPEVGPLVISDRVSRSSIRNEQRLNLQWPVSQLLEAARPTQGANA